MKPEAVDLSCNETLM